MRTLVYNVYKTLKEGISMDDNTLKSLVDGIPSTISDAAKEKLSMSLKAVEQKVNNAKLVRNSGKNLLRGSDSNNPNIDKQIYTDLSNMINGDGNNDIGGFGTLLDNLYRKNKKYYSIIKDYEIMPILIPQITRVLMFLVNESLTPDTQNNTTFAIKYKTENSIERVSPIQEEINKIKKEMKLDNLLREVYTNRYKLGSEFYSVIDYNRTFEKMQNIIERKSLNESTAAMSDIDYLESMYSSLRSSIDECTINLPQDNNPSIKLSFTGLNIQLEKSSVVSLIENAHAELINEVYSNFSSSKLLDFSDAESLNEATIVDTNKLASIVQTMKDMKVDRCTIQRLDPARFFKFKVGGRVIGYFYTTDLNDSNTTINFAQSLKDQLLKSKVGNIKDNSATAETIIAKELAEMIINKFDPNIGINRIEDVDLLHDYIINNNIYLGNKKIVFYYQDEIFDLSRSDGSLLTNAVFFTKLYSTLLLNNIQTKVLRGRGRQIHTVHLGASPNVQRYIQNAIATLTMPETNLGTLHGSFEQILNPFNSASDIIIPTDDSDGNYIDTNYIPGQDIDMDDNFLKMLLNSIITSFGLDAAVIDATNGNLQFARTLSMESLQISTTIRNEQQDLHDNWEALCLRTLYINGSNELKEAIDRGQVEVKFYEPKSLIIQNMNDDLNNVKSWSENLADIIPIFNEDGMEYLRSLFIYRNIKNTSNIDFTNIDNLLDELSTDSEILKLDQAIRELKRKYEENVEQHQIGDMNGDGITTEEDTNYDASDEEINDLMNSPDEEDEDI